MPLTFDELREANRLRVEDNPCPPPNWSPSDWMTALVAELGELAYSIKAHRPLPDGWPSEFDLMTIPPGCAADLVTTARSALGDVMICLDRLADALIVDLGAAVRDRFNAISEEHGSVVRIEGANT